MRKSIIGLFIMLAATVRGATIGQWNAYLAYHDITDIEPAGRLVYVLSSKDLFSYNVNDKSVHAYNKVNSLSDTEIDHIAWNPTVKRLLIVYSNFNIDLLDNDNQVENISDYYSKAITDDKTINNITISGNFAYLSTGFGILKLNMRDAEISETYNLGKNVTDCSVSGDIISAKTDNGIYQGKTTDNLVNPNAWTIAPDGSSISFKDANDITTSTQNGYTEYIVYDTTNKCYWSNQENGSLQGWTQDDEGNRTVSVSEVNADGPKYNYFGFMKFAQGGLYSCNGKDWAQGKPASIHVYRDHTWTFYAPEGITEKTGVKFWDALCLDVDPNDKNHVAVGTRNGLYEFQNGKLLNFYNSDNSPIESAIQPVDKEYELITGTLFDDNSDIWILNSGAPTQSILKLTNNKQWETYPHKELMTLNGLSAGKMEHIMIDSRGYMWFVNSNWVSPALYYYEMDKDQITFYNTFINQDGVNYNIYNVKCAAEDKDKNIWLGTEGALFYLSDADIKNGDTDHLNQYKVPRNDGTNLADYLLTGIDITCIAVDAANRKWYGTNGNGVYLISADNNTQEQHFLSTSSNLLSDYIESIAINDETGEVFFGTTKGLCSYMSDATQTNEEMTKDNVWAYPNPVKPEYTGLITITGLTYNADVKICTSNGVLVNEGRSSGGTYTWDGCDKNGDRVASGVYMVQTAMSDGKKGTVCKIAIVR